MEKRGLEIRRGARFRPVVIPAVDARHSGKGLSSRRESEEKARGAERGRRKDTRGIPNNFRWFASAAGGANGPPGPLGPLGQSAGGGGRGRRGGRASWTGKEKRSAAAR
ncbi:hypothetical protein KM043_018028 [Ampulex compressa]|nr:hypothetical protein KM043_018028 [Ampulex compressa]